MVNSWSVGSERKSSIPMEIIEDGVVVSDINKVLQKWKDDFRNLYNQNIVVNDVEAISDVVDTSQINDDITRSQVSNALKMAKQGKATGTDKLPVEVLCNPTCTRFLHIFFQKCFKNALVPNDWTKGIINPIPTANVTDSRDPLQYRAITLTSCVYKVFCRILYGRLQHFCEMNNILEDEQHGFRAGRSTMDHISSVCALVETRKLKRKSTFAVFVDFKQAYDRINRQLMFRKLRNLGLKGEILNVIQAIYNRCQCCVRLNGHCSEWFAVEAGLKQGCLLSTILFSIYINDLAKSIKYLNYGINLGSDIVSILLYADDIVLLAET